MSEHEPFIKTPQQLITVVALAFVVPVLIIILLVTYVTSSKRNAPGSDAFTADAIEARIRPVAGFSLRAADGPKVLRAADVVYKAQCSACHDSGAAGAPKLGDTAAWAPRIKAGYEALLASSLKGKGAMPPQGGGEFDDTEIGRAVVLMANRGGAKFDEPKAPAAVAQAPAAAAQAAASAAAPAVSPTAAPSAAPAVAAAATAAASVASAAPAAQAGAADGKKLYDTACAACHVAGVAGAPKLGDKAGWEPRLGQGIDGLTASVIKGKGAMPPKGGASASDAEIRSAVEYMVASVN